MKLSFLSSLITFCIMTLSFSACGGEEGSANNTPPQFESSTPLILQANETHYYTLKANDKENDTLTFKLTNLPNFIHYSTPQNGELQFELIPTLNDIGSYPNIIVSVSDGKSTVSTTLNLSITATPISSIACTYYADPINGNLFNDGSEEAPWGTLASIVSNHKYMQEGSKLCLKSGDHGSPIITNYHYTQTLTITAEIGEEPFVHTLALINSDHITIKNLVIDGSLTTPNSNPSNKAFLLNSDSVSHHLSFNNITLKSADDTSMWTKTDWYNKVHSGARFQGDYISVTNTLFLNTYHAVEFDGNYAYLSHSTIDNFAGDAIRGNGSFSTYEYNIVRDCYINDYAIQHDDAFQTFNLDSSDPKVKEVTLRFNKFSLFEDPITTFVTNNNLIGNLMQGVIITDGYADGWIVENNLIVNDQLHGISLYGVRNSRVQNNTVIQHPHYSDIDVPRIYLDKSSKTGQLNFNNTIRNNIAGQYTTWTYASDTVFEGNIALDRTDRNSYLTSFEDYDALNFHLKAGASAIDAGVGLELSDKDLDGESRVKGSQVDAGAFEF